jgi:tRNA threonylcarbamoyladenosine biosynthesis protein TsaE
MEIGRSLSGLLKPGQVVAFRGDLAAGKTTMIQGICAGLRVQNSVESPTYTLVNEYQAPQSAVFHIDCYREERITEWLEIGITEYLYGEGVALIEWAERIAEFLPSDAWQIQIEHDYGQASCRIIRITATDAVEAALREQLVEITEE